MPDTRSRTAVLRCLVTGHAWSKVAYPDADTADAFFLRCRRCGKVDESPSSGVDGAMGAGMS